MHSEPKQEGRKKKTKKRTIWMAIGAFIVAGVVVVTAMVALPGDDRAENEASFSLDKFQVDASDPAKAREAFREILRRDDLTDEQRRAAFRKMRESRRDMMSAFVDEYYNAPEEDKVVVLDDHIAEMQRRMAEWEKRRKEGDGPTPEEREAMRKMFQSRTQAERKADSESRNADEMARTMAYFTALRARMNERGISMPWGPGGRRRGGPRGGGLGRGGGGGRPGGRRP